MKLNKTFITHTAGNEQLMISAGGDFSGMVRSNATAARIVDLLKSEITREGIIDVMLEEYDVEESLAQQDIDAFLQKLIENDLID